MHGAVVHIGGQLLRLRSEHADGAYGAELRAILEAVWHAPTGCHLTIRSDSRSAVDAIHEWQRLDDIGRNRHRMPCRPLLHAIDDAINTHCQSRTSPHNDDAKRGDHHMIMIDEKPTVTLQWIAAHTDAATADGFGNRIVDCQAKYERTTTNKQYQLDVGSCERWIATAELNNCSRHHIISGDVRQAAVKRLNDMAAIEWKKSPQRSPCSNEFAHMRAVSSTHH